MQAISKAFNLYSFDDHMNAYVQYFFFIMKGIDKKHSQFQYKFQTKKFCWSAKYV